MSLTQILVIAAMQVLAEVFPIGAEGHFAIGLPLTGWERPGLAYAITTQAGLLLALMAYFWSDLWDMGAGVVRAAKGKRDPGARLAAQLLAATIPALGLGFAFTYYVGDRLNSLMIMGWCIVGFGLLLLLFDSMCMTVKRVEHATYMDTILVGVLQVLALMPGASRAGLSMTMGRLLGYERPDAARLSALLGMPVLLAFIGRDVYALIQERGAITNVDLAAGGVTFVIGLIATAILMSWLRRSSFLPFVVYRLLLGAAVLTLAYGVIEL